MCLFFLSYGLDLFFSSLLPPWVSKVSTLGAREGKFRVEVGSFYLAHSGELLRRKRGWSLVLDATRQNSWTFTCVQLFAVSWLLLSETWELLGDYERLPLCPTLCFRVVVLLFFQLLYCSNFCVWCAFLSCVCSCLRPDLVLYKLQSIDIEMHADCITSVYPVLLVEYWWTLNLC